ncbi:hypothetical protein AX14_008899 [Amanita brunnescens Koide BX004]|nr:hypothetical protein AX14_008899 [Amanita brunnescens Koide BX004]
METLPGKHFLSEKLCGRDQDLAERPPKGVTLSIRETRNNGQFWPTSDWSERLSISAYRNYPNVQVEFAASGHMPTVTKQVAWKWKMYLPYKRIRWPAFAMQGARSENLSDIICEQGVHLGKDMSIESHSDRSNLHGKLLEERFLGRMRCGGDFWELELTLACRMLHG